jgi:hypothetical protein
VEGRAGKEKECLSENEVNEYNLSRGPSGSEELVSDTREKHRSLVHNKQPLHFPNVTYSRQAMLNIENVHFIKKQEVLILIASNLFPIDLVLA